ncbi:MAG: radical SAM protein [Candidatus Tectomicrobia bacterium]|uniref:Radical SAM protein n=1 Tax=Tectimicrobiota bacterium TaxID=2528274 RepID=A0A932HW54_UNCTE|nr:radical SAM protein [Candidatus Tectomicrobia bacterium]
MTPRTQTSPAADSPRTPECPRAPECPREPEWTEEGAVLLVSCYELGRQPLGAAAPLAFLRRAGFRPAAMDVAAEPFSGEKVLRARLLCVSVPMHTALRLGLAAARRAREMNPGCHICFFGLYALLNASFLLENGGDSCLGGEAEASLVALAGALAGGHPLEGVPGLALKGRAGRPLLEKLPWPAPSREGLPPLASYARLARDGELLLAGAVEASRGCKHLCLHCPIPPVYGGRFFAVPRETVLEDVRRLAAQGARHLTFADPDFLNGPSHSLRVARAVNAEFPGLTFDFTAKVSHLVKHRDLLPELARLGGLFAVSAVESLNDRLLGILDKGHTREDVFEALAACRAAGLSLRPSLLAFTPWTSAGDYFELLDFIEEERLQDEVDPVQMAIRLLIPPGSALLGRPDLAPHLLELDQENFVHRWAHPDPRMDRLHEEALSLAEEAAAHDEDPALTFARLRALAARILEMPGRAGSSLGALPPDRARPPRLTESWFC